jgi:hypothetical protein
MKRAGPALVWNQRSQTQCGPVGCVVAMRAHRWQQRFVSSQPAHCTVTDSCHSFHIVSAVLLSLLTSYAEGFITDHQFGFESIDQLLITHRAFVIYWGINESVIGLYISYFTDFSELLIQFEERCYTVFSLKFGIPMKLVTIIQMCSNETHSGVR